MHFKLLAAAALVAACTGSLAAPGSFDKLNNAVTVYAGKQNIDYTENDRYDVVPTSYLDTENGAQTNFGVRLRLTGSSGSLGRLYGEVDLHRARGKTDYDGYLQNLLTGETTPYKAGGHRADTDDLRVRLGYGFDTKDVRITPFIALASHRWARMDDGEQYQYRENYSHKAAGAGFLVQVAMAHDYFLEVEATLGRSFDAKMRTPADGNEYQLQARKWGQLGLSAAKFFTPKLSLSAGVAVDRFSYGESQPVGSFFEPESDSYLTHYRVGVSYSF